MGLDVYLKEVKPCTIWAIGITHNLNTMAEAAGLYECMWRPDEMCNTLAMAHDIEFGTELKCEEVVRAFGPTVQGEK